ncbi:MAG: NAD+ synthase [Candidatus Thorarchaeota archaeon]|jgi:NAD+ synthase
MELPDGLLIEDYEEPRKKITTFIRDYFEQAGVSCVVIGLSGGIDSSLVATLACKALGPDKVKGLLLPVNAENDADNVRDASELAESLGMNYELFEIGPAVEAYRSLNLEKVALGNLMARLRMAAWYGVANNDDGLVLGTGNKSEILIGYFTKYGDGGVDILPIAELYKVNVWGLARHIGLSDHLCDKVPSAGLWANQTDEGEIGVSYPELDSILYLKFEKGMDPDAIISSGYSRVNVNRVLGLVSGSHHKRNLLPKAQL